MTDARPQDGDPTDESDSRLSTPSFPTELIPAESDEDPQSSEESRAKADPNTSVGPDADADDAEFTDPSAQPPT